MTERDPESLVPIAARHRDDPPVSAESVKSAYRGLVRWMQARNAELAADGGPFDIEGEGERYPAHVPFALQEVLADYIAQQEAIHNLVEGHKETPCT